ncbi:MAG: helix-turn-helix transcriptional regulator [Christensenellaceae bacterium]|jgi:hypothetical protein|nr:helix-turn-helix transcriptional regulator [Christensenellaceae bacterium]PWM01359.1 MAG: XRE family transcriptional regulator [Selenomonadales bacterium]
MVKLNILNLLEKKGKTKYWLYNQMGMSYQNFNNMVSNKTKGIKFETIETLCLILECAPGELFSLIIDEEPNESK